MYQNIQLHLNYRRYDKIPPRIPNTPKIKYIVVEYCGMIIIVACGSPMNQNCKIKCSQSG